MSDLSIPSIQTKSLTGGLDSLFAPHGQSISSEYIFNFFFPARYPLRIHQAQRIFPPKPIPPHSLFVCLVDDT